MPRVAIPTVAASRSGAALTRTTGDPVNNHYIDGNDGRLGVIVKNGGSTVARTVTFRLTRTVDGFAVAPRTETLAAGEEQFFGPFGPAEYGGRLLVDVDNAELTLVPVRI
ncbi:hypothetical protein AB0I84_44410 [Streptomyces spectabilis]|uniref:hypothetical protein n=1 Tax=Streptomyces spectabilis TaxID=68270 RepID=UPI00340DA334